LGLQEKNWLLNPVWGKFEYLIAIALLKDLQLPARSFRALNGFAILVKAELLCD